MDENDHRKGALLFQARPGRYEVRMVAGIWVFTPIRVLAGSTVTFVATSRDLVDGFFIRGANVNVMLLPCQVAT